MRARRQGRAGGFTLLEVMVALAILALAVAAITGATQASGVGSVQTHRVLIAAQLVRGVVLDIEEEYQVEGFPENDRENQDCEVPEPWDRVYDCEYDIEGMETDAEVLAELSNTGAGGALANLSSSGAFGRGQVPTAEQLQQGGLDVSKMMALAPLFGPEGSQLIHTCGVNIQHLLSSLIGLNQFFPQIVEQTAKQTRKLTVRLAYRMALRTRRTLEIETFIIATPQAEEKDS